MVFCEESIDGFGCSADCFAAKAIATSKIRPTTSAQRFHTIAVYLFSTHDIAISTVRSEPGCRAHDKYAGALVSVGMENARAGMSRGTRGSVKNCKSTELRQEASQSGTDPVLRRMTETYASRLCPSELDKALRQAIR